MAAALRLDEERNDLGMQSAHAALKLSDFGLYLRCPKLVSEFQAECHDDLLWREMNRQDAICVRNTLYLFRESGDPIDDALVRALPDEKALGFPREQRCRHRQNKADKD